MNTKHLKTLKELSEGGFGNWTIQQAVDYIQEMNRIPITEDQIKELEILSLNNPIAEEVLRIIQIRGTLQRNELSPKVEDWLEDWLHI